MKVKKNQDVNFNKIKFQLSFQNEWIGGIYGDRIEQFECKQ
jgi:hypothetical protein